MSKLFQALLSGLFFTFFMDYFFLLGIKINYIDKYIEALYYDNFFADTQNIFIYTFFTLLIGYLVIYLNSSKMKITIVSILFILSSSTLIEKIGFKAGEFLFLQKDVIFQDKKHTFIGDVYYSGRTKIIFYDTDLKKIITLNKKELIQ